jgi:hypothetical protein
MVIFHVWFPELIFLRRVSWVHEKHQRTGPEWVDFRQLGTSAHEMARWKSAKDKGQVHSIPVGMAYRFQKCRERLPWEFWGLAFAQQQQPLLDDLDEQTAPDGKHLLAPIIFLCNSMCILYIYVCVYTHNSDRLSIQESCIARTKCALHFSTF